MKAYNSIIVDVDRDFYFKLLIFIAKEYLAALLNDFYLHLGPVPQPSLIYKVYHHREFL